MNFSTTGCKVGCAPFELVIVTTSPVLARIAPAVLVRVPLDSFYRPFATVAASPRV